MSTAEWHNSLQRSGFTGGEVIVNDYKPSAHMCSLIVSRCAKEASGRAIPPIEIYSFGRYEISEGLSHVLRQHGMASVSAPTWQGLQTSNNTIYVILDSGSGSTLANPSDKDFQNLTSILTHGEHVLFVSMQDGEASTEMSKRGLANGFARVARSENPGLRLILLDVRLDLNNDHSTAFEIVAEVLRTSFSPGSTSMELEYSWRRNCGVQIARLLPASRYRELSHNAQSRRESTLFHIPDRPLRLQFLEHGLLDSMIFVTDDQVGSPLGADEIETESRAFGMNFKEVMVALGQLEGQNMIGEFAGIITRIGSNLEKSAFRPGDRVCGFLGTPYASRPRAKCSYMSRIPPDMSFTTAASIPVVFLTAYHSLVEIARLSSKNSVLIHSASGGVGQAAIQIAQSVGAEIFATVGSVQKRQLLIDEYAIPKSHIFSNRTSRFKHSIMAYTRGEGIDVILNSLTGDLLLDTWECIARFGTFIEIGKIDISSNSPLNMRPFERNVSFSSVDLITLAQHRPNEIQATLEKIMLMFEQGDFRPMVPITTMPLEKLEDAFRMIQARQHTGKVVLEASRQMCVRTIPAEPRALKLSGDATYLIAGGRGSMGQQIVRMMGRHGARHIVLLSRRARKLDGPDHRFEDVNVYNIKCDITDSSKVIETVKWIRERMPPIKGVIQAAMVLKAGTNADLALLY